MSKKIKDPQIKNLKKVTFTSDWKNTFKIQIR